MIYFSLCIISSLLCWSIAKLTKKRTVLAAIMGFLFPLVSILIYFIIALPNIIEHLKEYKAKVDAGEYDEQIAEAERIMAERREKTANFFSSLGDALASVSSSDTSSSSLV